MMKGFILFFIRKLENGSLFVGLNSKAITDLKEREELITLAHKALEEVAIDVSRILTDEYYGEQSFYVNNRIDDALEILLEIEEEF